MKISGGSTPLAKEGARVVVVVLFFFFLLTLPMLLPSAIFLIQRAPPLDLPLQMDKYKEMTGFDVHPVKTFNLLFHFDKRSSIYLSC